MCNKVVCVCVCVLQSAEQELVELVSGQGGEGRSGGEGRGAGVYEKITAFTSRVFKGKSADYQMEEQMTNIVGDDDEATLLQQHYS